jgi:hypothetical protein
LGDHTGTLVHIGAGSIDNSGAACQVSIDAPDANRLHFSVRGTSRGTPVDDEVTLTPESVFASFTNTAGQLDLTVGETSVLGKVSDGKLMELYVRTGAHEASTCSGLR